MNNKYIIIPAMFFLIFGFDNVFAWMEYQPVIFVGDMSQIYSKMPIFHGYTQEFLNSPQAKQICQDAQNDGVRIDYCQ
jgi:hypothetical protein